MPAESPLREHLAARRSDGGHELERDWTRMPGETTEGRHAIEHRRGAGHTHCRSCEAPIVFVPSATSNARLVLDAKPEKRVVLELLFHDGGAVGTVAGRAQVADPHTRARVVDVWTDHHATCPAAEDWKNRTRRNPP